MADLPALEYEILAWSRTLSDPRRWSVSEITRSPTHRVYLRDCHMVTRDATGYRCSCPNPKPCNHIRIANGDPVAYPVNRKKAA